MPDDYTKPRSVSMSLSSGTDLKVLVLKRHEDRRLRAGHAWVFSNEVDTATTPLDAFEAGELVRVVATRGQFAGYAYVNPRALICARILSRDEARPVDDALLSQRLASAFALRSQLGQARWGRLVYGESDGLPGLVLDRFDDVVVGQVTTWGMERLRPRIEALLPAVIGPHRLVWKDDTTARDLEGLPHGFGATDGAPVPETITVQEQDLRFEVPLAGAQKTGWFYDQTANRARLRRYLPAGARVLDVCSYAGAWAVTALSYGAREAVCVDSSQAALDAATRNAAANGFTVETRRGDAFDVLASLADAGERFDAVIVDPPAFIKRRKDLPQGEAAYRKLNQLALRLTTDRALLVSCSCSWHLPADSLPQLVQAAAVATGRELRVLEFGGQSPDHPVHPAIPETRYLKSVFCHVERVAAPTVGAAEGSAAVAAAGV
jgi:23S rRNA (cytosine1962-C5)-methyltransferase